MKDEEAARQTINAWYEANPSAHLGEMPARALVAAVAAALADARRQALEKVVQALLHEWQAQNIVQVDEVVAAIRALE